MPGLQLTASSSISADDMHGNDWTEHGLNTRKVKYREHYYLSCINPIKDEQLDTRAASATNPKEALTRYEAPHSPARHAWVRSLIGRLGLFHVYSECGMSIT
jgi:hypothetical protein